MSLLGALGPQEVQKHGSYRDSNAGPLASYAWVCERRKTLSLSENHTTRP